MTVWLKSTTSTMKDAAALAARGEPHGTVVVAEAQTAGVGRHGRSWHSDANGGLYLSIILRLNLAPDMLPILTMALGLATQRAINETAGVHCDLRWPNDVLLNEKKLAGILVQNGDSVGGALIAGIGVNVNQKSFPPELEGIATSLRLETKRPLAWEGVMERVVAESLTYAEELPQKGKQAVIDEFERHSSYAKGKMVEVEAPGGTIRGVTAGLDENGYLRIESPNGVETIVTGGVRPVTTDQAA